LREGVSLYENFRLLPHARLFFLLTFYFLLELYKLVFS